MNILLNSKPSPCLLINCTPNNVVVRNVFDRPFIITFVFSPTKPSANNEANQAMGKDSTKNTLSI